MLSMGKNNQTQLWIDLDKQHCWHPFTQQQDWTHKDSHPIILEKAEGVWLQDSEGHRYLDGNITPYSMPLSRNS